MEGAPRAHRGVGITTIQTSSFDYTTVPDDMAKVLRHAAEEVQRVLHLSVPEIGRHLLAAKAALPHGRFGAWAEAELQMKARTAQNYMRAATWLDGKSETLAQLPPTIVYALAAPDAPDEVVKAVVTAAEAGAPLLASAIKSRLDLAAVEESELRFLARQHPKKSAAQVKVIRQERQERARREHEAFMQQEEERKARLAPLVASVADACLRSDVDITALAADWSDWRKFMDLLQATLNGSDA